ADSHRPHTVRLSRDCEGIEAGGGYEERDQGHLGAEPGALLEESFNAKIAKGAKFRHGIRGELRAFLRDLCVKVVAFAVRVRGSGGRSGHLPRWERRGFFRQ